MDPIRKEYLIQDLEACDFVFGKHTIKDCQNFPQYHFDRDEMNKVWKKIFGMPKAAKEWCAPEWDKIETELAPAGESTKSFIFWYDADTEEMYFYDKRNKVQINYYKMGHLGRTNTCSDPKFSLKDLEKMFKDMKQEVKEKYFSNSKAR